MNRFHIALGVTDIKASIQDYTKRLNSKPEVVIDNTYALFRTQGLNISIRKVPKDQVGLRHLGWESENYSGFHEETDCNGWVWEYFRYEDQRNEILEAWPEAKLD